MHLTRFAHYFCSRTITNKRPHLQFFSQSFLVPDMLLLGICQGLQGEIRVFFFFFFKPLLSVFWTIYHILYILYYVWSLHLRYICRQIMGYDLNICSQIIHCALSFYIYTHTHTYVLHTYKSYGCSIRERTLIQSSTFDWHCDLGKSPKFVSVLLCYL